METGFSKYEREMLSSRLPIAATMKYLDLIKSTQKLDFSDHPEVMADRAAKKADSKVGPNIKIEQVDDWKIENLTPQQLKKRLKNRKRREKKKLKKKILKDQSEEKVDEMEVIVI